jgi:hypothetical protein
MVDEYEFVEWDGGGLVHNWRKYISTEIREMWRTLTREQKLLLVRNAESQAEVEEWD